MQCCVYGFSSQPPISAAIRIPSLYLTAITDVPVTYGYLYQTSTNHHLPQQNKNLPTKQSKPQNHILKSEEPKSINFQTDQKWNVQSPLGVCLRAQRHGVGMSRIHQLHREQRKSCSVNDVVLKNWRAVIRPCNSRSYIFPGI